MKEKFGMILIIAVALLCLFGCKEKMPEDEMVKEGVLTSLRVMSEVKM